MYPIRVGIVGVGTPSPSEPAGSGTWGALTHLPALRASPRYKIVAITNSTVESAKTSIAFHKLDAEVKAYGSAEEMAKDPEIDLVVISVIVPKHYGVTKPLLLAKKDVFVEWPLAANTAENEELADLAKSQNVKGIVGTQARANPLVVKIKELIDSGTIGTVLSSTATGSFMSLMRPKVPDSIKYYVDKDSGGNNLTIFYGHFLDSFIHVLGNFKQLHAISKTSYPTVDIISKDGTILIPNHPKTAPDHIFVHGTLESDIMASVNFREVDCGTASGAGIRWTITGTEGEIEITAPEIMWQIATPGATLKVRARNQYKVGDITLDPGVESDTSLSALSIKPAEVEDVMFEASEEPDYITSLSSAAKGVARTWEAFANGETSKYATFEDARAIHRTLDYIKAESL
ncbi:hypothetical protein EYC84_007317 [Monilinia fructicola]|uniref:Uncharacterized protein n=1 Tax=Monilinia fructicola TaxID=38448 RepID=A0A5M9JG57_MONFR|nr:hypothetical protein EYC84_007317 [Monilinia fructicola]